MNMRGIHFSESDAFSSVSWMICCFEMLVMQSFSNKSCTCTVVYLTHIIITEFQNSLTLDNGTYSRGSNR